jgi:hypothetical protein
VPPRDPGVTPSDGRGRHAARVRLQLLRLATVVLCALGASLGTAASVCFALPPEEPVPMADPLLDTVAFYRDHLPDRAGRGASAFIRGEPLPVAGLSQSQTDNAFIIIEIGKLMQLPKRAYVVAVSTALQESNLRNLANPNVAASVKVAHEGLDSNYDSVGLFQQRPSMGWGSVEQLMDPAQPAARFYARLIRVSGWQSMSVTSAAQAVQRSAFPAAYAKHVEHAQQIVDALL